MYYVPRACINQYCCNIYSPFALLVLDYVMTHGLMNYVLLVKAKPTDFADLPEPVIHPALAAPAAAKLTEVISDCGFSY